MADEDLEAELFGDYDSAEETQAAPAEPVQPAQQPEAQGSLRRLRRLREASPSPGPASRSAPAASSSSPVSRNERNREERREAKRQRRADIAKFFEREAQEAAGSSEEDEDGDADGLIDDSAMDHSGRDRARQRAEHQRHERELEEVRGEMARRGPERGAARVYGSSFLERMEERYKAMEEEEAAPPGLSTAAPSTPASDMQPQAPAFIVPDARDPKLWCARTFAPEKELCIALMLKAGECFAAGRPVPIFSVFYSPHLRGYIYIEAFRESDIRDFVRGIRGISPWGISLVPLAQMAQVFTAAVVDADRKTYVQAGDWVRIGRGPYKGDLALVDEVRDTLYVVKLKPRLQYGEERAKQAGIKGPKGVADKAYRKRPPARWFNRADLQAAGVIVNTCMLKTGQGHLNFYNVGEENFRDGFLYKTLKAHWFVSGEQVRPQEHELQDWRFAPPINENTRPKADLPKSEAADNRRAPEPFKAVSRAAATSVEQRVPLMVGDIVIVVSGELTNLRGEVVQAITGSPKVLVRPLGVQGLDRNLELDTVALSKYFQTGDHVKVLSGPHKGDTGVVLKLLLQEGNKWGRHATAVLLSTSLSTEYRVRVEHLRLTSERADPEDRVGEFVVEQLVRLRGSADSWGMVVRIEGMRATVLTEDGQRRIVPFLEMEPAALPTRSQYEKAAFTTDRKGQRIFPKSMVKAPRGLLRAAPIKAQVLHVHGTTVFLKACEALTGEAAYLACSGRTCEFVWATEDGSLQDREADQSKKEEQAPKDGGMQYGIVMASETSWLKPWFKKMMGLDELSTTGPTGLYAKGSGVRITGGDYKGLRAEIRDTLGDKVRVSLLCKPKLVEVSINHVAPDTYERLVRPKPEEVAPLSAVDSLEKPCREPGLEPSLVLKGEDDDLFWEPSAAAVPAAPVKASKLGSAPPATPTSGDFTFTPADSLSEVGGPTSPGVLLPERRRRPPRLPPPSHAEAASPVSMLSGGPVSPRAHLLSQSPSALFEVGVAPAPREVRAPWLMPGLGVTYRNGGQEVHGWIVKVYADTAHVVPDAPEGAPPGPLCPLKGSDIKPWLCERRGEVGVVFDGARRGAKGKVIGLEKEFAYLRVDSGDTHRVRREDLAKHREPSSEDLLPAELAAAAVVPEPALLAPGSPTSVEPPGLSVPDEYSADISP